MSDERPKRMGDGEFEAKLGAYLDHWGDLPAWVADEARRARASEKRLADTMRVISFLVNQVLAACRESDFAQVAEGLTVIREHFAAALSEVES